MGRLLGRGPPCIIEKLMDNVGHLPGVLSAGVVNNVPFSGHSGKSAATVAGTFSALVNQREGTTLTASRATTFALWLLPAVGTFPHRRGFTSLGACLCCG